MGCGKLAVEIAGRSIDGQHADVLQQCCQENVLGVRRLGGFSEGAGSGGAEQCSAPESWIIDAHRSQGANGGDQREAQGQGQCGVQSDNDQRLPKILARAAL